MPPAKIVCKNDLGENWYQPSARPLLSAYRKKPGGVNKHSTFRDAERAHYNRNHSVILESQKVSLTVGKLVKSTQSIR